VEKEKILESIIYQKPYVEHIRKKYFSLFSICIMDIDRQGVTPNLELITAPPSFHNDKVRSVGAAYTIDLKV
jgi:hypothetical protein